MDLRVYELLNGAAKHSDAFEDVLRFVANDAQLFFLALLAGLFLARGKWASRNGRHGVVAAGFSALLALGAAQVISHLWDRPRPYEAHPNHAHLFVPASHDPSFPSDHATGAFAIAVAIFLRDRRAGGLALVMATLVCVSRVAVGTHYPTDVLGGALLGALAALVLWLPAVRRPLHGLADWAGRLYEHLALRVLRQRQA
ncbi:MAG: phosphatase PAP2 family protein [Thermoleophilaceae bacterium]